MKKIGIVVLFISFILSGFCSEGNPQAKISNGILSANFYLPDAKNGYYRATRFDWSGIISSLNYDGHNYFGKWFEDYDPKTHDAIMGPVDSFGPLNYDEANPGDSFVKIGVGTLTKPSDKKYRSFTTYPIVDPGKWIITKEDSKIEFYHVLKDKKYPYEYTKIIEFVENKPVMVISYQLKNNGKHTIETQVFNHNFFVFDNQPITTDFEIIFPNNISGTGRGFGDIVEIQENKLVFKRALVNDESVYCGSLEGINHDEDDHDIRIENRKTGAGVRIKGNQPISNLVFWGNRKTVCPEPYITIRIAPGDTFTWKNTYEFYNRK